MAFQKSFADEWHRITSSVETYIRVFGVLKQKNDTLTVRSLKSVYDEVFREFDTQMVQLCEGNSAEMTEWNIRMQIVRDNLGILDRQFGFFGTPHLDWDTLITALAWLEAIRFAVKCTLANNRV